MELNPTVAAAQIRYRQWLDDIRACRERPASMTVNEWCQLHGIKKNTYYWRMKTLRKLCLQDAQLLPAEPPQSEKASAATTFVELPQSFSTPVQSETVTLTIGNATIEIPESISDPFLLRILEAARHA